MLHIHTIDIIASCECPLVLYCRAAAPTLRQQTHCIKGAVLHWRKHNTRVAELFHALCCFMRFTRAPCTHGISDTHALCCYTFWDNTAKRRPHRTIACTVCCFMAFRKNTSPTAISTKSDPTSCRIFLHLNSLSNAEFHVEDDDGLSFFEKIWILGWKWVKRGILRVFEGMSRNRP